MTRIECFSLNLDNSIRQNNSVQVCTTLKGRFPYTGHRFGNFYVFQCATITERSLIDVYKALGQYHSLQCCTLVECIIPDFCYTHRNLDFLQACALSESRTAYTLNTVSNIHTLQIKAVPECGIADRGNTFLDHHMTDPAKVILPGPVVGAVISHGTAAGDGQGAILFQNPNQIGTTSAAGHGITVVLVTTFHTDAAGIFVTQGGYNFLDSNDFLTDGAILAFCQASFCAGCFYSSFNNLCMTLGRGHFLFCKNRIADRAMSALCQTRLCTGCFHTRLHNLCMAHGRNRFLFLKNCFADRTVLAFCQTGLGTGCICCVVNDLSVAFSRNHFLLDKNRFADRTMLTLGQTGFSAGRCLCFQCGQSMTSCCDFLGVGIAASTGVGHHASLDTSGCIGFNRCVLVLTFGFDDYRTSYFRSIISNLKYCIVSPISHPLVKHIVQGNVRNFYATGESCTFALTFGYSQNNGSIIGCYFAPIARNTTPTDNRSTVSYIQSITICIADNLSATDS